MMAVHRVTPLTGPLDATVDVPGSKSVANRALICAALADGPSTLHNLPHGDDTAAMLDCLGRLGIEADRNGRIVGTGGELHAGPILLPARLAGTTSRFISAVAALGPGPYLVDGLPPLRARPMAPLHDALAALGADIEPGAQPGHLPVTISGPLRGGRIEIGGDISSQFITALMLVGPYLPGGLDIAVTTPLVSRPYLAITKSVMADFGHDGVVIDDRSIAVAEGRYRPRDYTVEPDASSAGYPLAAAAICGGRIEIPGLTKSSAQGDAEFAEVLAMMGCASTRTDVGTVVERSGELNGLDIDMGDLSDLVPTLAAVACFATTTTRIQGVGFIRAKESDRLGDLCRELRKMGADATETADGLIIEPVALHGATCDTHHDHRLAMAFGLVGLRVGGVEIADPDVVSKSWPGYWDMLEGLR
jgi:3-phosphoshikimate 1-carboxyvinyltransferase